MIRVKNSSSLKAAYMMRGMNQKDLAEKMGCTQPYLSNVITGVYNPSPKFAARICAVLDIDMQEYFIIEGGKSGRDKP